MTNCKNVPKEKAIARTSSIVLTQNVAYNTRRGEKLNTINQCQPKRTKLKEIIKKISSIYPSAVNIRKDKGSKIFFIIVITNF